jgi:hypothetical protein
MRRVTAGSNRRHLRCCPPVQWAAVALQARQSPWSSAGPTDHAEPVDVVVESRSLIEPPLALAQRENSTVRSPKSAVSPRPPRRESSAARTASFLAARSFPPHIAGTAGVRVLACTCIVCPRNRVEPHVRSGFRFVQCLASCSSRSPSSPSPLPQRPLASLPARALQPAPSFLREETGCMRRSRGCMQRLQWSRPSWLRFVPSELTRPT